jgi:Ser/Thr protein kinase RdoA (MazF antagonist)
MIIPPEVRQAWPELQQASQFRPIAEGLSSSQVWRVQLPNTELCLKAWLKTAITPQRLTELHQFQSELSDSLFFIAKIERSMEGAMFLKAQDHVWELSSWLPGAPVSASRITLELGQAAIQAVAQMHATSQSWKCQYGSSPSVSQRIEMLQRYQVRLSELKISVERADEPLRTLASQTLRHFHSSSVRVEAELKRLTTPTELFWVLRDLHNEHVLFENGTVSGIIDFGAARMDEPIVDLVRLLGSLWPMDRKTRHEMLHAYLSLKDEVDFKRDSGLLLFGKQPQHQQSLLERYKLLDEASTLLSAMQWLQWLVVERQQFASETGTLVQRWHMLVDRLDLQQW